MPRGGPRPNSGGARPGAGRKPKVKAPIPAPIATESTLPDAPAAAFTPLAFLLAVMNDPAQDPKDRIRAAVAAAQYVHPKKEGGKKDERQEEARKTAGGKFAPAAPPKLVVSNG